MNAEALQPAGLSAWLLAGWVGWVAGWPLLLHTLQCCAALLFHGQWERLSRRARPGRRHWPYVSVLLPVHNAAARVARGAEAALRLDYPKLEVIVIDDGSTDGTLGALAGLRDDPRLRLVRKHQHEGKAMALNDALALARGSILLCLDVEAEPESDLLRHLVPHFDAPRVAAVLAQPEVGNAGSWVAVLQALELLAAGGVRSRAQRVWGRVGRLSGAAWALRRRTVLEVGGFDPGMRLADVDLGWKLQRRQYDLRLEAGARCRLSVPDTWRGLLTQRWHEALGLGQLLRRHGGVWRRWRQRRLWAVWAVLALGRVWALATVALLLAAAVAVPLGLLPGGPAIAAAAGWWCLLIAAGGVLRLWTGLWLARGAPGPRPFGVAVLGAQAVWHPWVMGGMQTLLAALAAACAVLPARMPVPASNPARGAGLAPRRG